MKAKLNKVVWLILSLLAISACKKSDTVVIPPEQNKMALIADNTGTIYAVNALSGLGLWTYNTGGGSVYASPAVNKETMVYVDGQMQTVTCLNLQSGTIKWTKTQFYSSGRCSPIIVNDKVYIASYDQQLGKNVLLGLNLIDGSQAFEAALYSSINAVNYSNGLLMANTCGGHLYGIDLTGNIKWEYVSNNSCYHNNPDIFNKVIYILSSSGKLSAVNISDGTEVWSSMINTLTHDAAVVYNNGMLFVAGDDNNNMFAFDATNGTLKHTYLFPADQNVYGYRQAPVVKDGMVYIISEEGTLFAFNVSDETIKWQKTFARINTSFNVYTSLTLANDVLFAAVEKKLMALDLNGNIKWEMSTAGEIYNSPVILSDKDHVYTAGNVGLVE